MRRKPLSLPQIVILALLWITICYIILTGSEHIDGPLILSIIISGALVFIPLLKYLKERENNLLSAFSLHFVQIDIFTCIFFIICCTFQFLSIILRHQKKQEELINNYKKK